jgi:hypothetical protein
VGDLGSVRNYTTQEGGDTMKWKGWKNLWHWSTHPSKWRYWPSPVQWTNLGVWTLVVLEVAQYVR